MTDPQDPSRAPALWRAITVPRTGLVLLIGASGAGKSTFARGHFLPTEILSSDAYRALIGDDERDQRVSQDAFAILHAVADRRLAHRRLVVVDATNARPEARRPLLALARRHGVPAIGVVFDLPARVNLTRNAARPERAFAAQVVHQQLRNVRRAVPHLAAEGFDEIHVLSTPEEVEGTTVVRERGSRRRRQPSSAGRYDFVGDVHGCADELEALLDRLGYVVVERRPGVTLSSGPVYHHPDERRMVFVGDLVDRGPRVLDTLRLVRNMIAAGSGASVLGNHDRKALRALRGTRVSAQPGHGLERTLAEIEALPDAERAGVVEEIVAFLSGLPYRLLLDDGAIVVAHGGLREDLQGRDSPAARAFALYGDTTGRTDAHGLPERRDWAAEYRGRSIVIYGHTPVPAAEWRNGTINVDTGCVFGGWLSALRWPERELVQIRAARVYQPSRRPFLPSEA